MLRRVALVRTDDSEELSASFIRLTRIGELGTTLAVTSNRHTSVLTRATRRNIPEDTILQVQPSSLESNVLVLTVRPLNTFEVMQLRTCRGYTVRRVSCEDRSAAQRVVSPRDLCF
jgi:hypothetical protein